ncbi:hypothetical protein EOD41_19285 [Mucilaginibacter limnophilus]|uniref:Uncharacterized protein n=1 Tax=Mucilaginibacter limnophilus TaxID=1932778 RepID=A0A3S2ULW0_9SPHI|nr:hypothetical protein [Mucilaginibacter limnophilus]RVT97308.1 hypothetical protein EOD41_19285 [Mucilaginibacter limnophilus]
MAYDLLEKIREKLAANNRDLDWLIGEFEKSKKWFYDNRDITGLSYRNILQLSRLLKFDFLKDYNEYLAEHEEEAIHLFFEPPIEYKKPAKKMTVNLSITGVPNAFKDFDQVIDALKKEGEKHGFEID